MYANFHSYKDLVGDARCGLLELPEICRYQSRTALAPSTRHHNNKWPECNCAPAISSTTSHSSRKCSNMTPLGKRVCISWHRHLRSTLSQANEAAINPKLTGLCQHEIVTGILKKSKQCGTVQAPVVGAWYVTCAWASVSQFLPHTCATLQF